MVNWQRLASASHVRYIRSIIKTVKITHERRIMKLVVITCISQSFGLYYNTHWHWQITYILGFTPPKLYLGSFLNSDEGYHPYLVDSSVSDMMLRSESNLTLPEIRRPGNCGPLPLPENGKLDSCTKDINELWTACFISCDNSELYSTTRLQNRPYKFQCKPTGWTRVDTDKDVTPFECLGSIILTLWKLITLDICPLNLRHKI